MGNVGMVIIIKDTGSTMELNSKGTIGQILQLLGEMECAKVQLVRKLEEFRKDDD